MWAGDWSHEDCHEQLGGEPTRTCPPGYGDGGSRVISDCHFSVQLNHFMPVFLSYSVAVFLKCQSDFTLGGSAAFGGARTRWVDRRPGQGLPAGWDMDSDGQRATTCHNQEIGFIGGGLRSGVAIGLSDVLTHPPPLVHFSTIQSPNKGD
jgi:hypothetical protein